MTKENTDLNTISEEMNYMDDLLFANEICVGASTIPASNVSAYQSTLVKDNIQGLVLGFPIPTTNAHETFENFVSSGDQGDAPTTQFICPDVSPYQNTLFNNVVGDQDLVPEFTSTSEILSRLVYAPIGLPNTHVSTISQNTNLSEQVQSGWVQTSNFSNHPTPYEHVQPNFSNHLTPSEHVHFGWVQKPNCSNHPTPPESKSHCKRYERWTEDEHRLFLIGLEKCGWGEWKDISRLYILSKSPIQIASHAQKYRLHQKSQMKNKKRKSIHDITLKTIVVPGFVDQQQGLPPT